MQVVNGLNATNRYPADPDSIDPLLTRTNGTGNLIVGYNELGNPSGDDRTGSHNLVFGHGNSHTSFGGIVGPNDCTVSGPFASVMGGFRNTASARFSSVSGGFVNPASSTLDWVSGGRANVASGGYSSVSGGEGSVASGSYASQRWQHPLGHRE